MIAWPRKYYVRALGWVLRNRLDALLIALAIGGSIQIPLNGMQRTDMQERGDGQMTLVFEMPSGQSLEQAERYMTTVEDTVIAHKAEYNVEWIRTYFSRNRGELMLFFAEDERVEWYQVAWDDLATALGLRTRDHLDYQAVEKDLRQRLDVPPGVNLRVN